MHFTSINQVFKVFIVHILSYYHFSLQGRQVTSHPCVQKQLEQSGCYTYTEARVCCDGTVITSRGPGSCFEFALAIVIALVGEEVAKEISGPMMLPPSISSD